MVCHEVRCEQCRYVVESGLILHSARRTTHYDVLRVRSVRALAEHALCATRFLLSSRRRRRRCERNPRYELQTISGNPNRKVEISEADFRPAIVSMGPACEYE